MLRCHLARINMRIAEVARETGLMLYNENTQKVRLETLDKLCELFDCGIDELLKHEMPTTNKYQLHNANQ